MDDLVQLAVSLSAKNDQKKVKKPRFLHGEVEERPGRKKPVVFRCSHHANKIVRFGVIVVVQHLHTRLFVGAARAWVKEESGAKQFKGTGEAISFCVESGLREVRIGMIFGDPQLDIFLYPFRSVDVIEQTQQLTAKNEELKAIQSELVMQVKDALDEIVSQTAALPLKRKKKRRRPPEEP